MGWTQCAERVRIEQARPRRGPVFRRCTESADSLRMRACCRDEKRSVSLRRGSPLPIREFRSMNSLTAGRAWWGLRAESAKDREMDYSIVADSSEEYRDQRDAARTERRLLESKRRDRRDREAARGTPFESSNARSQMASAGNGKASTVMVPPAFRAATTGRRARIACTGPTGG